MITRLWVAIKESKKRICPAIEKQKEATKHREWYMQYFRLLTPLLFVPLRVNKGFKWFLLGKPVPNTKTKDLYDEIRVAGIEDDEIWHSGKSSQKYIVKIMRVLIRLPWLFIFFIKNIRIISKLDLATLQIIIGYITFKNFFRRYPLICPICISDLSPFLHMQWAGALAAGNKTMWWQDDYHHFKGFSAENYFPYPCSYAAVLNEHGFETVKQNSPKTKIYKRKSIKANELQNIPDNPKVGIATSAFFEGKVIQFDMINCLRKQVGASSITFRLHPNSKIETTRTYPEWIKFANQKEALEDFAKRIDIAIVGNSAVQLKLLCEGIPVVHISGLDPSEFDLYGYCKMGFIYGIPKNTDSISLCKIKTFYQNKDFKERIHKYVNVKTDLPELKELII